MKRLVAAFDVFPTNKGATTHIAQTVQAIRSFSGPVTLACLGYGDMPRYQEEEQITIMRCLFMHPNFLKRTELFGEFLSTAISRSEKRFSWVHFRDIWSGIPLLTHPHLTLAKKIFEVNAFPSIELPIYYPRLYNNPALMSRIRDMEEYCLQQADHIITMSHVTARCISTRHVPKEKITVIPNMADVDNTPHPPSVEGFMESHHDPTLILYAGTLTPWQGVSTLIKAFALLGPRKNLRLLLACSNKKFLRPLRKLIRKCSLEDCVEIRIGMSRGELHQYYQKALFTVAPLTRGDRNELQGCCPLKILESMAAGTPVIASRLEVCRELIDHEHDGWLVTPDSPRALAHAMTKLLDHPELVSTLGYNAQQKIIEHYGRHVFYGKTTKRLSTPFIRRNNAMDNMQQQLNTVIANMKISGSWPIRQLLEFGAALKEYDVSVEKKKKFALAGMIVCLVPLALIILVGIFSGGILTKNAIQTMVLLAAILLILGIVASIFFLRYRKFDVCDEFRKFLLPLLEHLQDDIKKNSTVLVEMPLDSLENSTYLKNTSDVYSKGAYHKCLDYLYDRVFLSVTLRLHDGNTLILRGNEFLKKTKKTKKNPRGKIKTKTKYTKKFTFDTRLKINSGVYTCQEIPQDGVRSDSQMMYSKQSEKGTTLGLKYLHRNGRELMPDYKLTLEKIATLYTYLQPKASPQAQE